MHKPRKLALILLGALALGSAAGWAQRAAQGNVESITAAQMKDYLTFIAADELEGRDTPSRGLDVAALYLATQLSRWGVKPAGENGTYFQPFPLQRKKLDAALSFVEFNGRRFQFGDDFLAAAEAGTATGAAVYVGHGWYHKAKNINAYQGLDVKGKILLASLGFPKGITPADLNGKPGEDWSDAALYAARHGAKGVIYIPGFVALNNWTNNRALLVEKGSLTPATALSSVPPVPVVYASLPLLSALLQGEPHSAATLFTRALNNDPAAPFELKSDKAITLNLVVKQETLYTKNVVGLIEGGDPALKNEYVALGAHYDHVGIGNPVNGDALYNGADDDGSGTVALMALAEAFAKGARPKRSLLFVWHAGEEKGLWGAAHFTKHPTVPSKQIITQLNMDMIGRCRRAGDAHPKRAGLANCGEVYVVGSKMMSTELGDLSETVNRGYLNLSFNYKFDDPKDPERIFFRSDHFHYAQQGIPIIFYTDGEHEDYHQPSDTIDKIDFEQMEKITRTVYATAWELGNRAQRPRVDKSLPAELMGN